jgi:hypothetical protein
MEWRRLGRVPETRGLELDGMDVVVFFFTASGMVRRIREKVFY